MLPWLFQKSKKAAVERKKDGKADKRKAKVTPLETLKYLIHFSSVSEFTVDSKIMSFIFGFSNPPPPSHGIKMDDVQQKDDVVFFGDNPPPPSPPI